MNKYSSTAPGVHTSSIPLTPNLLVRNMLWLEWHRQRVGAAARGQDSAGGGGGAAAAASVAAVGDVVAAAEERCLDAIGEERWERGVGDSE